MCGTPRASGTPISESDPKSSKDSKPNRSSQGSPKDKRKPGKKAKTGPKSTKAETNPKPETKRKGKPGPKPKTKTKGKPGPKPKTKTKGKPGPKPKAELRGGAGPKSNATPSKQTTTVIEGFIITARPAAESVSVSQPSTNANTKTGSNGIPLITLDSSSDSDDDMSVYFLLQQAREKKAKQKNSAKSSDSKSKFTKSSTRIHSMKRKRNSEEDDAKIILKKLRMARRKKMKAETKQKKKAQKSKGRRNIQSDSNDKATKDGQTTKSKEQQPKLKQRQTDNGNSTSNTPLAKKATTSKKRKGKAKVGATKRAQTVVVNFQKEERSGENADKCPKSSVVKWPDIGISDTPHQVKLDTNTHQPLCRSGSPVKKGSYVLFLSEPFPEPDLNICGKEPLAASSTSSRQQPTRGRERTNIAIGQIVEVFCVNNESQDLQTGKDPGWFAKVSRLWFPEETLGGRKHHHGAREVLLSTNRPLCHSQTSMMKRSVGMDKMPYPSQVKLKDISMQQDSITSFENLVSLNRIVDICHVRSLNEESARQDEHPSSFKIFKQFKREFRNKPDLLKELEEKRSLIVGTKILQHEPSPVPHTDPGRDFYVSHTYCHFNHVEVPIAGAGLIDSNEALNAADLQACHACRRFMKMSSMNNPCNSCNSSLCKDCTIRIYDLKPHYLVAAETVSTQQQKDRIKAFGMSTKAYVVKQASEYRSRSGKILCPVCETEWCGCSGCLSERASRLEMKHCTAKTRERVPEDPNKLFMQVIMDSKETAKSLRPYGGLEATNKNLYGIINKKNHMVSICAYCGDMSPDRRCEHCWADVHAICAESFGGRQEKMSRSQRAKKRAEYVSPDLACSVVGRRIAICEIDPDGNLGEDRLAIIDAYGTRRKRWRLVFESPFIESNSPDIQTKTENETESKRAIPWSSVGSTSDETAAWLDLNSSQYDFTFVRDVSLYCYCRHSSNMLWSSFQDVIECVSCGEKYHTGCILRQKKNSCDKSSSGKTSFVCYLCSKGLDEQDASRNEVEANKAVIADAMGLDLSRHYGAATLRSARGRVASGGRKAKRMACITCPDCKDHEETRRRINRWTHHRRAPLTSQMSERFGWRQSSSFEWIYCVNRWFLRGGMEQARTKSNGNGAKKALNSSAQFDAGRKMDSVEESSVNSQGKQGSVAELKFNIVTPRGENDTPIAHIFSKLLSDVTGTQRTRCFGLDVRGMMSSMDQAVRPPLMLRSTHHVSTLSLSAAVNSRRPSHEKHHLFLAKTRESISSTIMEEGSSTQNVSETSENSEERLKSPLGGGNRRNIVRNSIRKVSKDEIDKLASSRQKLLRFDRSLIHSWGLYADEGIAANEFIIEYKGEVVQQAAMEERQRKYEAEGRDDYIFRIDKNWFCDATVKGSMARFINHCCDPNCYTKILKHDGKQKIIIYAKRDICAGEELSYDYKFPYEEKKIVCNCGASNCRGYMN